MEQALLEAHNSGKVTLPLIQVNFGSDFPDIGTILSSARRLCSWAYTPPEYVGGKTLLPGPPAGRRRVIRRNAAALLATAVDNCSKFIFIMIVCYNFITLTSFATEHESKKCSWQFLRSTMLRISPSGQSQRIDLSYDKLPIAVRYGFKADFTGSIHKSASCHENRVI
jgi:hypothetical protein